MNEGSLKIVSNKLTKRYAVMRDKYKDSVACRGLTDYWVIEWQSKWPVVTS